MNIPVKKNDEYVVKIIDNGYQGEGITKIDGFTVFIPNAIKGEKVKIHIIKITSSYAIGKITQIIDKSKDRVEPNCKSYVKCGGCNLRHINYKKTLEIKRKTVQDLINKNLSTNIQVDNTVGMEEPYYYRNKAVYPIGKDKEGKAVFGVFANRTHEIISFDECKIQTIESAEIAKAIVNFLNENNISVYDEKTGKGVLRHIIIKYGMKTDEVMCVLVVNSDKLPKEEELKEVLLTKFSNIKTIVKNINSRKTNVILGDKNIVIYGNGYIQDRLGEYIFNISANSFYQVNPVQTEKLYNLAIEGANLSKEDTVFDLYAGVGTIGIFASKHVKKVYSIEIVEQAIKDAKDNAKMNNIDNIEFSAGDVEKLLQNIIYTRNIKPNAVFVDPPRRGLDENTVNNLLQIEPKKIIYISCNPATLIRDLKILEEKYNIKKITPVDLFPFTNHVETVCLLERRK